MHSPGAGGTTVARRIAWNIHEQFPTVVLRGSTVTTIDRLDELFRLSDLPLFILAEASVIRDVQITDLLDEVRERNVHAIFLHVVRSVAEDFGDAEFQLRDPMTPAERTRFGNHYSALTEDQRRLDDLQRMADETTELPASFFSPFFFGLITYEKEYRGLESYVESHLVEVPFAQRQALLFLALVTRYSQLGIPDDLISSWLGIPREDHDVLSLFGPGVARLLLFVEGGIRIVHPYLAEEVLRHAVGGGDLWKSALSNLAIEFIEQLTSHLGSDSRDARDLLTALLIRRDRLFSEQQATQNFAELIITIPSSAGAHLVFEKLTEFCPAEPHYWNHRGRHHIYEMKLDFPSAAQMLDRAVKLSGGSDPIHHHTLGMVHRLWMTDSIDALFKGEVRPEPEEVLRVAEPCFTAGLEAFASARKLAPMDEHVYVTPLQMILRVAERLVQASSPPTMSSVMGRRDEVGQWLRVHLAQAEELFVRYSRTRAGLRLTKHGVSVRNYIARLYGDFQPLIEELEQCVERGEHFEGIERSLAFAYLARRNRDWSRVSVEDARRIADLMDANLRSNPGSDRDIRLWFSAYRRLPEFSYLQAIERLSAWAEHHRSSDAHFYLYVLHALRWLVGLERNDEAARVHMEQSRALRLGARRQWSYEWVAKGPEWCPVINHLSIAGLSDPFIAG